MQNLVSIGLAKEEIQSFQFLASPHVITKLEGHHIMSEFPTWSENHVTLWLGAMGRWILRQFLLKIHVFVITCTDL